MTTARTSHLTRLAVLALAGLAVLPPAQAAVPGMKVTKLFSPRAAAANWFGKSSALTDRYVLVGEPGGGNGNGIAGLVHVFDAGTGAFVRTLKPTVSAANDRFGYGLSVQGTLALVRAAPLGAGDAVYLMDITTGKQLRKFVPGAGQDDEEFGRNMLLTDTYAIIGNTHDAANAGAVYIFTLASNDPPLKLTVPGGASGDQFGYRLYEHGSMLLISAPFCDGGKGAVHRFDLSTHQLLAKIQPANVAADDWFGIKMTGWGGSTFVSAQFDDTAAGSNAGSVYSVRLDGTFDPTPFTLDPTPGPNRIFGWVASQSGNLMVWGAGNSYLIGDAARRTVSQVIPFEQLGTDTAADDWGLANNRLLLGITSDSTLGNDAGAAFLVQLIAEPLAGWPLATKGDSAPGAAGIAFNDLNTATINPDGRTLVCSSLSGTGSNGGKDIGVFDDLSNGGYLDLVAKSRDDLGAGVKVASLSAPVMTNWNALYQATLTGTGVTALNNKSILHDDGNATGLNLRTGATLSAFGGATLASFGMPMQSSAAPEFATIITLRSGVGGTNATNDSGLALLNINSSVIYTQEREGLPSPISGVNFGQFTRVAYQYGVTAFTAQLSGPAAQNQAVFVKNTTNPPVAVMRKGTSVAGLTISAILAENTNLAGRPVIRASVAGAGINSTNNEGVWQDTGLGLTLIARTGSQAPGGKVGVLWHRFLQVCPQNGVTIIRGLLRGPGITAANDEIVCLFRVDKTFQVLMREGESAHGCNGAKLGAISRMEVSPEGAYRVLAALTGALSTNNLALLGGDTRRGSDMEAGDLRKPELLLRKGALLSLNNFTGPARVTSLAFTHSGSQDATGMGCKGLPGVTSINGTLAKVSLSDGTTHIMMLP